MEVILVTGAICILIAVFCLIIIVATAVGETGDLSKFMNHKLASAISVYKNVKRRENERVYLDKIMFLMLLIGLALLTYHGINKA